MTMVPSDKLYLGNRTEIDHKLSTDGKIRMHLINIGNPKEQLILYKIHGQYEHFKNKFFYISSKK